jgi:hypothetical protein
MAAVATGLEARAGTRARAGTVRLTAALDTAAAGGLRAAPLPAAVAAGAP